MTDAASSSAVTGSNQYQYNEQAQGRDSLSRQSEVGGNNVRPIRPSAGDGQGFGEAKVPESRTDREPVAQAMSAPSADMQLDQKKMQALAKEIRQDSTQRSNENKINLFKDVVSYAATAGCIAASSGAVALVQPLFRTATNMLHQAMAAFRNGDNGFKAGMSRAFSGALGSLSKDVQTAVKGLMSTLQKPKAMLHKKLLSGTEAPKTWAHLGALLGGLIGGVAGGPLFAGVGFLAGRYLGQSVGRMLSYATGNSGLTLGESISQSLTGGMMGLSDQQALTKINAIAEGLTEFGLGVQENGQAPLPKELKDKRKQLLQMVDSLEADYYPSKALKVPVGEGIKCMSWGEVYRNVREQLSLDPVTSLPKNISAGAKTDDTQSSTSAQVREEVEIEQPALVEVSAENDEVKSDNAAPSKQEEPIGPKVVTPEDNDQQDEVAPKPEGVKDAKQNDVPKARSDDRGQTPLEAQQAPKQHRKKTDKLPLDKQPQNDTDAKASQEQNDASGTEVDAKTETWGEMFSRWGSNAYSTAKSYLPFQG